MSTDLLPDYELADEIVVTAHAQLRAMADPLRATILDLLLERAATVAELSTAVQRPKSTVAHHVNVLANAGLLRVVRTRRVRAIDERYYGRTARVFPIGVIDRAENTTMCENALTVAAGESVPAHEADVLFSILRHARIPREHAVEFWTRVLELSKEFSALPRSGNAVYGFAAGLYPTDYPALPDRDDPPKQL
jgi:DNA-binding transcriptional ArsR family regulator